MRSFRQFLIVISSMFILLSCEGLVDENEEEGRYTFWSNFDGPPIDVFVENNFYGTISSFYGSNPGCDAVGCVTVLLPTGIYSWNAVEQPNNSGSQKEWDGTLEIKPNSCGSLGLSP